MTTGDKTKVHPPAACLFMDERRKKRILGIVIATFLAVYTILTVFPFYLLFIRSFVPTNQATVLHLWIPQLPEFEMDGRYGDMATYYRMDLKSFKRVFGIKDYINPNATFNEIAEKHGIPRERILAYMNPMVRFNGWVTILTDSRFIRSIVATIMLTASSVLVGGFLGVATGSVLARFRKRWHQWIYNLYMLQMIIPQIMIIVPVYIILARSIGLRDSYWALFLLFIKGGAISTMLFTSYLSTIPGELKESVDIDGGNRFHYFFDVLLPLAKVPFASYIAIHYPIFWNDLLNGLLFLSPAKYTLVPLINAFQGTFTTNYQAIYAGLAISVIPILAIYLVFQKLFVRSALAGALKG